MPERVYLKFKGRMRRRPGMRSIGCILVLLLYAALFDLYIYELTRPYLAVEYCKAMYCILNAVMIFFCLIDSRTGFESWWHSQFNMICFLALGINWVIMALGYTGVISGVFCTLLISNGSIFVVTLMILFSSIRHGEFNN